MNYKEIIKGKLSRAAGFFITFMRWTLISAVIGIICGFFGASFHLSIDLVTEIRMEHSWLIYLLPIGGIIIAFLYRQSHMRRHKGTDNIIESVYQAFQYLNDKVSVSGDFEFIPVGEIKKYMIKQKIDAFVLITHNMNELKTTY